MSFPALRSRRINNILALPAAPATTKSALAATAIENDTATFLIQPRRTRLIGMATETDSAFAITRRKSRVIGFPTETDTPFALGTRLKAKALNRAVEVDTALSITSTKMAPAAGSSAATFRRRRREGAGKGAGQGVWWLPRRLRRGARA
jgi:hypothetical protein